jgi:hypothetical protein
VARQWPVTEASGRGDLDAQHRCDLGHSLIERGQRGLGALRHADVDRIASAQVELQPPMAIPVVDPRRHASKSVNTPAAAERDSRRIRTSRLTAEANSTAAKSLTRIVGFCSPMYRSARSPNSSPTKSATSARVSKQTLVIFVPHLAHEDAGVQSRNLAGKPSATEPVKVRLGHRRRSLSDGLDLGDGMAVPGDHYRLPAHGAVDQARELSLRFGDAVHGHWQIMVIQ